MLIKDAVKEYKSLEIANPDLWAKFKALDNDESYWHKENSVVVCNSQETLKMELNGPEPYFKDFGQKDAKQLKNMGFEKISFERMRELLDRKQIEFNRPSWDAFRDHIEERKANRPTHSIFEIKDKQWEKIGVAWTNKDTSLNLKIEKEPADKSTLQIKPIHKQDGKDFLKNNLPISELFMNLNGKTKKIGAAWLNKDGSQNLVIKENGLKISGAAVSLKEIKRGSAAMKLQQRRQRQEKENTLSR